MGGTSLLLLLLPYRLTGSRDSDEPDSEDEAEKTSPIKEIKDFNKIVNDPDVVIPQHYLTFLPIENKLVCFDSLERGPYHVDRDDPSNWQDLAAEKITQKMESYYPKFMGTVFAVKRTNA